MGAPSHYRSNLCDLELGNGVQEVSSWLSHSRIPWHSRASKGAQEGLEFKGHLQRLHHVVYSCHPRLSRLQASGMVLHDLGRGPYDQELQVAALEHPSRFQLISATSPHRNTPAEQPDGAVVTSPISYVWNDLCKSKGVRRLVLKSALFVSCGRYVLTKASSRSAGESCRDGCRFRGREPSSCIQASFPSSSTSPSSTQARCGEGASEEVRAPRLLSTLQKATHVIRRVRPLSFCFFRVAHVFSKGS
jgi:hypothetical protein